MNNKELLSIKKIISEGEWYHTIIYDGISSNGTFNYNPIIEKLNFPKMDGLTVLDVGCSDGFFSKYFINDLNAKYVKGVDFNSYDGSVAFEVLERYKENFEEKYTEHNDFNRLKEHYDNIGLRNSNKFLLLKKIFDLNMEFEEGNIYNF